MNHQLKSKNELIQELEALTQAHEALQVSYQEVLDKSILSEASMDESLRQFKLLKLNSSDVIWTLCNDLKLTYISPSISRLLGVSDKAAMCKSIESTLAPHFNELFSVTLLEIKENVRVQKYISRRIEVEQYHKDGHLVWVEMTIRALLDNQGVIIGYVGESRNVTRRKMTEKAMTDMVQRFETLVAKIPVGLYVLRLRANGETKFDYVSDRWCEIHQFSREEAMSDLSIVNSSIDEIDRENFDILNRESIRRRTRFVWEGRMNCGSEQRWIRVESVPISSDSTDDQWFGVCQDITARKQVENALRLSEIKLRELNAQKDKFFSIIAHDLTSPFNAILGFSELLTESIDTGDYTDCNEYAELIQKSSTQAVSLLRNLLEWTRVHTGRMEYHATVIDLKHLVLVNQALFEVVAEQKSIKLYCELPDDITVYSDEQMTNTILRNLISNAIKFTKSGGEIHLSATTRDEEVIVAVRDNGVGMKPEMLEKLFQIDECSSTLGTNQEIGTGLGLVLCQEFIEKHGGQIWAESEPELGTTFYFTLFTQ